MPRDVRYMAGIEIKADIAWRVVGAANIDVPFVNAGISRFRLISMIDEAFFEPYSASKCTPDFFGFISKDELQYRGRLDASRTKPVANARRDLYEAMKQVADTGHGPKQQFPSTGCSIKWKH